MYNIRISSNLELSMIITIRIIGKMRSGISTSWNTIDHSSFDDESSEEEEEDERQSPESDSEGIASRRWASLGQLSGGVGAVAPLFQVKLSEAKQKNYLFGGLGSLLGTNELNRYFPDRKIVEPPYSLDDFILPDDMEHMPDMFVIVPEDASHSLRPGTYFKTKGAVAISFQFFGTKMLFVNTHLFAHEEKLQQRVQNYKQIVHNIDLPRNLRSRMMTKPKDVTNRFDIVFWLGDLNFRLAGPREEILERTKDSKTLRSNLQDILCFDQLNQSKNRGEIFHGFSEGNITFAPTFKFDVGTNHYDSSSKQRVPSYTDRILFKSTRDPVICSNYSSCPDFKTSDHKPVWGVFNIKVRPGKD
ncbi:inositol polyphosphate 5-phosphatase, partial [Armadillidium nasatum]